MATEKWIGGALTNLTWSDAASTALGSLPNTFAILSPISVANGTGLDIFADVSVDCVGSITTAAPGNIGVYLYALNANGTTYGDGRFTASTAGPPPAAYFRGALTFSTGAGVRPTGVLTGVILPPGTFSFVLANNAGATTPSTAVVRYRTYNRAVT